MGITNIKIHKYEKGNLRGFAQISFSMFDGELIIDGWKIWNGKNGLFVAPPSIPGKEKGKYSDTVRFSDKSVRAEINRQVLEAYTGEGSGADSEPEPRRSVRASLRPDSLDNYDEAPF